MRAAKKQQSASPVAAWLRGSFSWLFGPGRPVLISIVLVGMFGGGACLAWFKLRDRILGRPEYRIGPEQVEITPQPPWIQQSDLRAEVFCSPALDGPLSIMDDDLTERIGNAFAQRPWVREVRQVTKQFGSVKVELVYRKPVCMVEVPGGRPLPVDAEAVLLPSDDFSPLEAARYPQLLGVDLKPTGLPGSRWGDARVIGGAEIAAVLGDAWEPMRLYSIEPSAIDPATSAAGGSFRQPAERNFAGRSAEPFFTLVTYSGTRILWGYAPGANALGELSAVEKVARLKRYFAEHDTLDGLQGKPQELDFRKPPLAARP